MKTRIITAFALILVLVPIMYFCGIAFTALSTVFGFLAGYEIVRLFNDKCPKWVRTLIPVIFAVSALSMNYLGNYMLQEICVFLIFLLTVLIWNENVHFDEIGIVFMVYVFMVVVIATVVRLHEVDPLLIFMVLFATYFTDTFALFGGMAFGRHKLNERISPNKTIEGSVCGYIMGAAVSLVFGLIFIKEVSKPFIIASCLIMPLTGQMGDLAFSAIKRYFKVKDFGTIFPGHGGVLDRIDSALFNITVAFVLASVLL
ncbi:MAG: phosphatidate cytidylyltransferase [Erysipelotrichaceae bacterium]|nr:phosphatidate cytidylyltransferase [Erysipelotrichaceae bacterium]